MNWRRRNKDNPQQDPQRIMIEILKEMRDSLNTISNKLDTMNTNLSNKLDTVSNKLDRMNTNLSNKLDTVINNTGNIARGINVLRAELSEKSLLNLFIEYLREEGYKILRARYEGSIMQEPIDAIILVEKDGEKKELYIEVKTSITKRSVENIKKKFKGVHGDKWVLARFVESGTIKEIKEAGINIFAYNTETHDIEVINGEKSEQSETSDTSDT